MEDELFDYGTFKLRKDALVYNINNEKNLSRYIDANRLSEEDALAFREAVAYIARGISNGSITKDLEFIPEPGKEGLIQLIDNTGGLSKDNKWHGRAIGYLGRIASAQGSHKSNKKATEIKKKEYQDISTYLAKSLYPNATGLTDPNIDWDSFKKKYSGQAHKAAYDILSGFTKSENTNPELKAKLETILPKLVDADGITADDKLELNRAGISGQFIPFLEKLLEVVTPPPPEGGQDNNGDGDLDNGKKEDPPVITPQVTIPKLGTKKSNIRELKELGDYYIKGHDENREQWVLWDNKFHKVPMSFIEDEGVEEIRKLLKDSYRNLYESENMEQTISEFIKAINDHAIKSENIKSFPILGKIMNLYKLLSLLNLPNEIVIEYLNRATKLLLGYFKQPTISPTTGIVYYNKQGGNIIKALDGTELDNWFTKRYSLKALTNWTPKLRKNYWKLTTGFHGNANSLASVYDANTNYTSDLNAIRSDLNNYAKNGKFTDKTAFINDYNTKIKALNDFFKLNRTYGEDSGEHATTFKDVYASRSGSGNLNYDLGFLDDLKTSMGSTMWHRRADLYEKEFNNLTDIEKQSRLHFVDGLGYVYKNADGSIAAFDDENEAKRILALKAEETSETVDPSTKVKGNDNETRVSGNEEVGKLPNKEEQIELPEEPSKLKANLPFIAAGLYDAYKTNSKINNLLKLMPEAYQEPINLHRNVYGNLRALAEANRRAGLRNALARLLMTADGSFNAALMMDTFNKNVEDWQNALAIDDLTQKETSEKAYQELKEAYLKNHDIFWGNTLTAVQGQKEDIISDMAKEVSNYQSRKNALDEWKTYFMADVTKQNELNMTLSLNRLWNHILQSPVSYIGGWSLADQALWDRYQSGENITDPVEKLKIMKIQEIMNDIYLQKRFPNANFKMPHMNNIRLGVPKYEVVTKVGSENRKGGLLRYIKKNKNGGKVTNDLVKAIIQYLKESNKNYNKAIDRSVKGLYNSIKLQKERKK